VCALFASTPTHLNTHADEHVLRRVLAPFNTHCWRRHPRMFGGALEVPVPLANDARLCTAGGDAQEGGIMIHDDDDDGRKWRKKRGVRRECLLLWEEMKMRAEDIGVRTTGEREGGRGERRGPVRRFGIGIFTKLPFLHHPPPHTHTHTHHHHHYLARV
jgi:hypothetical protein